MRNKTRGGRAGRVGRASAWCALAVAFVLALCAVACALVLLDMKGRASVSPSGHQAGALGFAIARGAAGLFSAPAHEDNGFPDVDWDWWRNENSDVVAWVTVPNTPIDYPVVQAPKDDPGYYLKHDVFRQQNMYGCPYLDADNADVGLAESSNVVVLGHNMSLVDGSMFTAFSRYADESFARSNSEILLQTPSGKIRLKVVGARVVEGGEASKRVHFDNRADFEAYCEQQLGACSVKPEGVVNVSKVRRLFTFVTCSYTRYENERTLVYAIAG